MNPEQALMRNMRTCRSNAKREAQMVTPQGESTDAEHRGGLLRSSDEVPVMGAERGQKLALLTKPSQPDLGGAG